MRRGRILRGTLGAAAMAVGLLSMPGQAQAQLLDEAIWFEREAGAGITWRYYHFKDLFDGPQSISYMTIDLDNPAVELEINFREAWVGPSPGLGSPDFPRQLTSVFAGEITGSKAAINGSFFNTSSYNPSDPDAPWGGTVTFLKVDGIIIDDRPGYNGGVMFNDRTDVTVSSPAGSWAAMAPSWDNMMINGPLLLENGAFQVGPGGDIHPRTALGVDTDTNTLLFLVVDGRTDEARGMTVHELAQTLEALGANDAFNLDGGGSSTMWVEGEPFNGVVNYPSDNGTFDHLGQRRAANAIVVISDPPTPKEWDGCLSGLTYDTLVRTGDPVTVTATYENIGTETWTAADVSIVPSRPFGRTSDFIPDGAEDTFFVMDPPTVAPGESTAVTLNLTAPDVSSDTLMTEEFALWHETEGYFGPADSELRVRTLVRPELDGAPPLLIVQPLGHNSQWYSESGDGGGFESAIGFGAEGVVNDGTQRGIFASGTNRSAIYAPVLAAPGIYRVDAAFPHSSNNITAVQYIVDHMDGEETFTLNQNNAALANTWNTLGQFPFTDEMITKDGVHSVTVTNGPLTGNRFYPGAIRWDYVGPLEDTAIPGWEILAH